MGLSLNVQFLHVKNTIIPARKSSKYFLGESEIIV